MKAERFEDLRIWQSARLQAARLYGVFGVGTPAAKDFGFRDQIQRCAVSVMNNIAEGFERQSDPDFARFLNIAKGSNGEVRSMLFLAEDLSSIDAPTATGMRHRSEDLSRGIQTLSSYLRH
jgi:four helix bundle protein